MSTSRGTKIPLLLQRRVLAYPPYCESSSQLQAKYTDLLLLNKHDQVSEREYDILLDALGELNDTTPRIRISPNSPPKPEILFGLDTTLFEKSGDEKAFWDGVGKEGGWHGDEVETKSVWLGGQEPSRKRQRQHVHKEGEACGCGEEGETMETGVKGVQREVLEQQLKKLNFEIYRGKPSLACIVLTSSQRNCQTRL